MGNGGGIRASFEANLYFKWSKIEGCLASNAGGGVHIEDGVIWAIRLEVLGNEAGKLGGGIAAVSTLYGREDIILGENPWTYTSCTIEDNKSKIGGRLGGS